ncbi:MAG: efflux system, outer rane lipoprotein NodT family [Prosthecobacter sp.]|nr:efflux system, outer rane lipoprotein NodT family [Prosthecobacter sp.]
MKKLKNTVLTFNFVCLSLLVQGCGSLKRDPLPSSDPPLPARYPLADGAKSSAMMGWREYFKDPNLTSLIGTALNNNQELNILLQEIAESRSEVKARRGAILPFVTLGTNAGLDKVARNTPAGALEDNIANEIRPGSSIPSPTPNYAFAADFDWEVDIWRKLRNERDAAVLRYLATQEGRNFMVTNIVSEIAQSYYELLAFDNQLTILKAMIQNQQSALEAVKLQKANARVTELAVRRFEAEVLKNQSRLYKIQQQITVAENKINYLVGRYPQRVQRRSSGFESLMLTGIHTGMPAELLRNRPDVRQAELKLAATGLDVKAAAARFYPSLNISAALGLQTFTLGSVFSTPGSLIYGAAANLAAPLINRSAIQAAYNGASARQVGAIYTYQQTVLKAYIEVVNQLAQIRNYGQSFNLKSQQVAALSDSINIAGQLFFNARADYTEVLFTQRDALEARIDLVELKQEQLNAFVKAYKALGGGYNPNAGRSGNSPKMAVPKVVAGQLRGGN